jgi:hypothetical protein
VLDRLSYQPINEKSPASCGHRALESSLYWRGRVSQAQAAHGERIRRLTGKIRINALFVFETRP